MDSFLVEHIHEIIFKAKGIMFSKELGKQWMPWKNDGVLSLPSI